MNKILISLLIFPFLLLSCTGNQTVKLEEDNTKVLPGIDALARSDFQILEGKKVGLVTNPTGVNSELKSTVDILFEAPNVNLVALFGPEHGVRGNFSAGDHVNDQKDPVTGLPVYSLYGANRKPSPEMLEKVDVLVYDIQDIGVRSYTYISTMGLVMEAAAENGKQVVVLDRPNPLGGNRIEGPLVEKEFTSFISQYPIPYVYGLTCGELAVFLNEEGMLTDSVKCKLEIVRMQGWNRNMSFNKTGLQWIPSSPHIPTWETAFYYAATGIVGEIDPNMIGIGYPLPFQTLVTENIDAITICKAMNSLELPGVSFRPVFFKPYYMAKQGVELQGAQIHITDFSKVPLTEIQFLFLQEAKKIDPDFDFFTGMEHRYRMFDLGCGTDTIRKSMMENYDFTKVKTIWEKDVEAFREKAERYYLYE